MYNSIYIEYIYNSIYIFNLLSKLPAANVPLRALEGWVTREDVLSVGVRSMRFGKIRFD